MQIRLQLPTYGQVAAQLDRSSPGLQTRLKLANYLLLKELNCLEQCNSVTMRNDAVLLNCTEDRHQDIQNEIRDLADTVYREVFGKELNGFFSGNEFIS